ncbi:MAG: glycosyltransferase [Flavobacterium sp.]|nr:glycosyltransferase [Flavobacterium sp.]
MLLFIFFLFIAVIIIQFVYYIFFFGKFSFTKLQVSITKRIPISVIVCAKNEEENAKKFIPLLLNQNYPNFEIVLIDDASSDNTLEIFEAFEKTYPNVKVVKVENNEAFWGNKKFALTLGIKAAKNEYLLFTDADCFPISDNWIQEMSSNFTQQKTIILGYGAYLKIKNSFLNKIIRFETLFTATQYFAWTKLGKPYMGVGRNMAYKREEFFKTNGFIEHMKIRSGDDDLFINQASYSKNTTICFTADSFTMSKPKTSYKDWFTQKRRHISTARHYKSFDRIQLALFYITQLLFLVLSILLLSFLYQWIIVLSLIIFRYIFTCISLGYASGKLKEKDVMYWFPIIEIILIFTQLNIFITNIFSKPASWK